MFNFDNLPTAKIEPFTVDLPRALSREEIEQVLSHSVSRASIPNRNDPKNLSFEMELKELFVVEPSPEGSSSVICTPNGDAIDAQAVRWCMALTKLPPKSLPRTQRPIINILKRLPEKPTGNPAIDKGRRVVLDRTLVSLWPAIAGTLVHDLAAAAK